VLVWTMTGRKSSWGTETVRGAIVCPYSRVYLCSRACGVGSAPSARPTPRMWLTRAWSPSRP
jgi:hypothetical protein